MDVDGEVLHAQTLRGHFDVAMSACDALRAGGQPCWADLIEQEFCLARGEAIRAPQGPLVGPGSWRLALFLHRLAFTNSAAQLQSMEPPEHPVGGPMAHAWRALATDQPLPDLYEPARLAKRAGLADLLIECHVLRVLALLRAGELDAGLRHARLASRMARTESIPSAEYLAGVTLARARRSTGFPHLAAQILRSVRTYAPSHWHRWIDWELTLSGDRSGEDPASRAAIAGCDAALAGDMDALNAHMVVCEESLRGLGLLVGDATGLLVTLLPHSSSQRARPFSALAGDGYVLCAPGAPGQRIRATGLALQQVPRMASEDLKQKRCATLTAALGLAGGTLPEDECFEEVYGFPFVPQMHRGTFDVLLHRTRQWLEEFGTIERRGGGVCMTIREPFAVPDPRESQSVESRVLQIIASGGSTARAAADATGLSLRQAQSILKSLTAEGACVAEKQGPKLHYRLEDTTFSEPTRL